MLGFSNCSIRETIIIGTLKPEFFISLGFVKVSEIFKTPVSVVNASIIVQFTKIKIFCEWLNL